MDQNSLYVLWKWSLSCWRLFISCVVTVLLSRIGSLLKKLHALLFWLSIIISWTDFHWIFYGDGTPRGLTKVMLEEDSKEDDREGWSEASTLLHSTLNIKCLRCQPLIHDGPLHVIMEELHGTQECGWTASLAEGLEQAISAQKVEGLF